MLEMSFFFYYINFVFFIYFCKFNICYGYKFYETGPRSDQGAETCHNVHMCRQQCPTMHHQPMTHTWWCLGTGTRNCSLYNLIHQKMVHRVNALMIPGGPFLETIITTRSTTSRHCHATCQPSVSQSRLCQDERQLPRQASCHCSEPVISF